MKTPVPENISFKIEGIELLEYSMKAPQTILPDNLEYKFEFGIEHKINLEIKKIFVICSISILSEQFEGSFANAKISCIYGFPEIETFFNKDDKKIEIPENVSITLNSITLSTCRGVMFTLLRGTFLHYVILPIVDPKTFTNNGN